MKKVSKLPQSFDARDWVVEWLETIKKHPDIPTDEGTMLSWFANALMAGYDEATRRNKKKIEKLKTGLEKRIKSLKDDVKGLKFYIKRTRKKQE